MTRQSTWVPKNPPLIVGESVVVTAEYSPFKGRTGKITKILGPFESPWMRTDRWMSDWFAVEIDGELDGFLEDQIERI